MKNSAKTGWWVKGFKPDHSQNQQENVDFSLAVETSGEGGETAFQRDQHRENNPYER